jgi:hypothetical protein
MKYERGNALFYILIAIGLLATLSYAIANSMRGNVQQLSGEQARLAATEIIGYSNNMAQGVSQLRLRGVADTEISLENTVISGYVNPNCSADLCRIFKPDGAGLSYTPPKVEWLDVSAATSSAHTDPGGLLGQWYWPENTCVWNVGTGGNNCDADTGDITELMVWLPWLKKEVCVQINELIGVPNTAGDPPTAGGVMIDTNAEKFTGTYPTGGHTHLTFDDAAFNTGVPAACVYHDVAGPSPGLGYFYYKVLIAR